MTTAELAVAVEPLVVWRPSIAGAPCDECGSTVDIWFPLYRVGPSAWTWARVPGHAYRCHRHLPQGAPRRR
jgi:hypothetical protein